MPTHSTTHGTLTNPLWQPALSLIHEELNFNTLLTDGEFTIPNLVIINSPKDLEGLPIEGVLSIFTDKAVSIVYQKLRLLEGTEYNRGAHTVESELVWEPWIVSSNSVKSVNGQTGEVVITAQSLNAYEKEAVDALITHSTQNIIQDVTELTKDLDNLNTEVTDLENNLINHNHNTQYAPIVHTHTDLAPLVHTHNDLAPANHNHNAQYAEIIHTHIDLALANHNHNTQYAPIVHTHADLALANHNHNAQYAEIIHAHTDLAPINHDHDLKYAKLTDFNQLDNNVTNIATALTTAQQDIDNAETRLTTVETTANNNKSDITTVIGDLATLSNTVDNLVAEDGTTIVPPHNHDLLYAKLNHAHSEYLSADDLINADTLEGKTVADILTSAANNLPVHNHDDRYPLLTDFTSLANFANETSLNNIYSRKEHTHEDTLPSYDEVRTVFYSLVQAGLTGTSLAGTEQDIATILCGKLPAKHKFALHTNEAIELQNFCGGVGLLEIWWGGNTTYYFTFKSTGNTIASAVYANNLFSGWSSLGGNSVPVHNHDDLYPTLATYSQFVSDTNATLATKAQTVHTHPEYLTASETWTYKALQDFNDVYVSIDDVVTVKAIENYLANDFTWAEVLTNEKPSLTSFAGDGQLAVYRSNGATTFTRTSLTGIVETRIYYPRSEKLTQWRLVTTSPDTGGSGSTGTSQEIEFEYYVNTTGNDTTGDGTSANPFLTLKHAIESSPKFCNLTIRLQNNTCTLTSPFISTQGIKIGMRKVTVEALAGIMKLLKGSQKSTFLIENGGSVTLTAGVGGGFLFDEYLPILAQIKGEGSLRVGVSGGSATKIYLGDAVTGTFHLAQFSSTSWASVNVGVIECLDLNKQETSKKVVGVGADQNNNGTLTCAGVLTVYEYACKLGANYQPIGSSLTSYTLGSTTIIGKS